MLKREEVIKILNQAQRIDSKYELFGSSRHKYKLNPPITESYVRSVEKKYGFILPEDYFRFITEVGDGGAGPDYGITPFMEFLAKGRDSYAERYYESYRHSLANPFMPRQMMADEVDDYAIATKEAYEQSPERYFIYEKTDANDFCHMDGFFVLGTHGCQWDFGIITSGERRGQVFDTDNEGAYGFVSRNFDEFYQNWLDRLSDAKSFQKELEDRRALLQKIHKIHEEIRKK